jgi:hypothetical protein
MTFAASPSVLLHEKRSPHQIGDLHTIILSNYCTYHAQLNAQVYVKCMENILTPIQKTAPVVNKITIHVTFILVATSN